MIRPRCPSTRRPSHRSIRSQLTFLRCLLRRSSGYARRIGSLRSFPRILGQPGQSATQRRVTRRHNNGFPRRLLATRGMLASSRRRGTSASPRTPPRVGRPRILGLTGVAGGLSLAVLVAMGGVGCLVGLDLRAGAGDGFALLHAELALGKLESAGGEGEELVNGGAILRAELAVLRRY